MPKIIIALRCSVSAIIILLFFPFTHAHAGDFKVALLLSNSSAPYQNFTTSFSQKLPSSVSLQVNIINSSELLPSNVVEANLIVAIGIKATQIAMLQDVIPVLAVMVPESAFDALQLETVARKRTQSVSAIYLNQPWSRQLHFLLAILPNRHKIGLLYTSAMQKDLSVLRAEAVDHGVSLVVQNVAGEDTLSSDLEKVLHASDVVLAVPDSAIYSSSNVRNILLSTYRLNIPLLAWSQSFVNAGALAALFSTPEQLAEQSVNNVLGFMQTRRLTTSQYPNTFKIAINQQVARSLGIVLASDEDIRFRMQHIAGLSND